MTAQMTIPRLGSTPLADWLATAAPGDRVIVQTAPHNANDAVAEARDAGLITTAQKRACPTTFHLIATRLKNGRRETAPLGRGQVGSLEGLRGPKPETIVRWNRAIAYRDAGMSLAEIAAEMGTTRSGVKNYFRRAREAGVLA